MTENLSTQNHQKCYQFGAHGGLTSSWLHRLQDKSYLRQLLKSPGDDPAIQPLPSGQPQRLARLGEQLQQHR